MRELTIEEAEYLRLTKEVNRLKNEINEAEKEKAKTNDELLAIIKEIDKLDEEYGVALDNMLNASDKVRY